MAGGCIYWVSYLISQVVFIAVWKACFVRMQPISWEIGGPITFSYCLPWALGERSGSGPPAASSCCSPSGQPASNLLSDSIQKALFCCGVCISACIPDLTRPMICICLSLITSLPYCKFMASHCVIARGLFLPSAIGLFWIPTVSEFAFATVYFKGSNSKGEDTVLWIFQSLFGSSSSFYYCYGIQM